MAEGGNINKNASSSVVDWSVIPNCKFEEELQGLEYEDNLKVIEISGKYDSFCDEKVPGQLRDKLLADINSTFSAASPWSAQKKVTVEEDALFEGYEFVGTDGHSRLQCWMCDEYYCQLVVYNVGNFAILVGSLQAHPTIRSGSFTYDNSDGSHFEKLPYGPDVSAEVVLEWMLREVDGYCGNTFH